MTKVLPHKGFVYLEPFAVATKESVGIYIPVEEKIGPVAQGVVVAIHSSSTVMSIGRKVAFISEKALKIGDGIIVREEDVIATLQEG